LNQAKEYRLNRFMNWLLLKGKVQMGEKQSNLTIEMLLKECKTDKVEIEGWAERVQG